MELIQEELKKLIAIQTMIKLYENSESETRDQIKEHVIGLGGRYSDPSVDVKWLDESKSIRIDADRFQELIYAKQIAGDYETVNSLLDCRVESKIKARLFIKFKRGQE